MINNEEYDWLIVGSGLTGSIFARRAAEQGMRVHIVEKRTHFGGNCFDTDMDEVLVHKYGPHCFHTNSEKVWEFINRIHQWREWKLNCLTIIDGKEITLPINFESIDQLLGVDNKIVKKLKEKFENEQEVPILQLIEHEDVELNEFFNFIFKKVFVPYSEKMWGVSIDQLSTSITARVPVRMSYTNGYFSDKYQALPKGGYTEFFKSLLKHKNITIELGVDSRSFTNYKYKKMLYTGKIDDFFECDMGELKYRSLDFKFETIQMNRFQREALITHPAAEGFTRIIDHGHFTEDHKVHKTVISYEYPCLHEKNRNEALYPMDKTELFFNYKKRADELKDKIIFAGRLADYHYYNMDQAMLRVLNLFDSMYGIGEN